MANSTVNSVDKGAPSRGLFPNTGNGVTLQPVDIKHPEYTAVVAPDTAFWALVRHNQLADMFREDSETARLYRSKAEDFGREMDTLRFGLKPSAVYFNPTERCNLNCTYCYIPETMRRDGSHMSADRLLDALAVLKNYFAGHMPEDRKPQIIFHGAEPMMNREAMFEGIRQFDDSFNFGVQTNATLLDDDALRFLTERNVGIGLSLDGPVDDVVARTRKSWAGESPYAAVVSAMDKLRGYDSYSVICTVTSENMESLTDIVDFFHAREVPACMLNVVRCTLPSARAVKPEDSAAAHHFIAALEQTSKLYQETGRKLVVANFANILISILAPTARRLMCDISPCGGGRSFFALAPDGSMFPCSEFIGLPDFNGGNLFTDAIDEVLKTPAFRKVSERKVEDIAPCSSCAIRHFCGSPCPAEAQEMNGGMDKTGAFCEFYEEQVRYAMRLIADGRQDDFLWDGWDQGTESTFDLCMQH